jgi:hypothetical protein
LKANNLELCILGIFPYNASIVKSHFNSKELEQKQKHNATKVLSFQRLYPFILGLCSFAPSFGANNIHTQEKQNHNQAYPKKIALPPTQFPSLLHKSTTTPLNDKRKTNHDFWCLDTGKTFFVHTLNPNSGILYTILGYTTCVWVGSMSLHPLFCLPISISNKYTTHAPQIAPLKCTPLFESKHLRKSSTKWEDQTTNPNMVISFLCTLCTLSLSALSLKNYLCSLYKTTSLVLPISFVQCSQLACGKTL